MNYYPTNYPYRVPFVYTVTQQDWTVRAPWAFLRLTREQTLRFMRLVGAPIHVGYRTGRPLRLLRTAERTL